MKQITLPYLRNKEHAPKLYNNEYGQDIEPAGEYMIHDTLAETRTESQKLNNWEYGYIKFNNPLFVEYINTDSTGWKKSLSEKYNNLTGKGLSKAILKSGYDAIITVENGQYVEIVNLNGEKLTAM